MLQPGDHSFLLDASASSSSPASAGLYWASAGVFWAFPFDLSNRFHVFAMEWNSTGLTYFFDGEVIKRPSSAGPAPQPKEISLSLGLAPGVSPTTYNVSAGALPTTFYVDYIRVWQRVGKPRPWVPPP